MGDTKPASLRGRLGDITQLAVLLRQDAMALEVIMHGPTPEAQSEKPVHNAPSVDDFLREIGDILKDARKRLERLIEEMN